MKPSLPDSLRLRTLESEADVARLAEFNAWVHRETDEADPQVGAWTRQLFNGAHPTTGYDDCLLVEDERKGDIISSLCVIPQTWTYEGLAFDVGRVELVGTAEAYRKRGLIRLQMDAIHTRSEAQGHAVQAITGIPYYYRQFGYEFALELGGGLKLGVDHLPEYLNDGGFKMRDWCEDDIPELQALYEQAMKRYAVVQPRTPELWRYLFAETDPASVYARRLKVVARRGEMVGYVVLPSHLPGDMQTISECVMAVDYRSVLPWLLKTILEESRAMHGRHAEIRQLYFHLGGKHPIYPFIKTLGTQTRTPYAWYIRVPDVAGFVRRIGPVLERRLKRGNLAGMSAEIDMSFYRSGLRMVFEDGRLIEAENIDHGLGDGEADYSFPPGVFLQILFGYRSLKNLQYAYPDVYGKISFQPVLDVLFPRRRSWVFPLY